MRFPTEIRRTVLERNQFVGEKEEKCVFQGGGLSLLGRKRYFFFYRYSIGDKRKRGEHVSRREIG